MIGDSGITEEVVDSDITEVTGDDDITEVTGDDDITEVVETTIIRMIAVNISVVLNLLIITDIS